MASFSSTGSLSSTLTTSNAEFSDSVSQKDFAIYLHHVRDPYITFSSNTSSFLNANFEEDGSELDERELREDLIKCRRNVSVSLSSESLSLF